MWLLPCQHRSVGIGFLANCLNEGGCFSNARKLRLNLLTYTRDIGPLPAKSMNCVWALTCVNDDDIYYYIFELRRFQVNNI